MSEAAGRMPRELPGAGGALLFGDGRLARRAAQGDQRAFAAIFRRYHQDLYRYCRAILGNPDDAQDALQATMVRVLAALPGETREIALKPWLFRIARNEAISLVRRRPEVSELQPEEPDMSAALETHAVTRESLRELISDLDELPERQRSALVMRELNGLRTDEIAAALGVSAAAAKQAVYEARTGLHEMAEGRELDCEGVRESISARDRRLLRGRRVRAHLRACRSCADFEAAIGRRRAELAALAPPLVPPAALAALHGVLGGGGSKATAGGLGASVAAGAGSGLAGGGLGAGAAIKTAAAVLATAAVAGGAAELGVVGGDGARENDPPAARAPQHAEVAGGAFATDAAPARNAVPALGHQAGPASDSASAHDGRGPEGAGDRGRRGQDGQPPGAAQQSQPPNSSSAPAVPPGHAQTPPGQSGSAGAPPVPGPAPQASATGQSQASSAGSASAGAPPAAPGQSAVAPGAGGQPPAHSHAAGGSTGAPGQQK